MNKVITINLNGNAYQLEEDGYEALRTYLDRASRSLEGNPDRAEIMADIEQSIADKFRAALGASKNVVATKEVEDVLREMGPVQDDAHRADGGDSGRPAAAQGAQQTGSQAPRRLFRIREGAKIGGVCNGLAAYLGIEVTIIRLLFIFVALTFGAGVLAYIIMMVVIPAAETPAEKAEACGSPATAEEFIRRAREGYYAGMRSFGDKKAYREWKRQFKHDMRRHGREFARQVRYGAGQWHQYWHNEWARRPEGSWIVLSIVSVLLAIVSILGILAIASLVLTGAVFGFFLPPSVPLWMGIVFLVVATCLAKWPLKEIRHGYWHRGPGYPWYPSPFAHMVHSLFWLAAIVILVWFADHHSHAVHDMLWQIRRGAHDAVDSLRDWWRSRP